MRGMSDCHHSWTLLSGFAEHVMSKDSEEAQEKVRKSSTWNQSNQGPIIRPHKAGDRSV